MAKAACWTVTDVQARKRGEQTGLDLSLIHIFKTGIPVSGVQYRKRRAAHPVYQGAVRPHRSGDRGRRGVSVSYTHLDVYKRQYIKSRAIHPMML